MTTTFGQLLLDNSHLDNCQPGQYPLGQFLTTLILTITLFLREFIRGNYLGWELSRLGNDQFGNCPGEVIRGGTVQGKLSEWELSGGSCLVMISVCFLFAASSLVHLAQSVACWEKFQSEEADKGQN